MITNHAVADTLGFGVNTEDFRLAWGAASGSFGNFFFGNVHLRRRSQASHCFGNGLFLRLEEMDSRFEFSNLAPQLTLTREPVLHRGNRKCTEGADCHDILCPRHDSIS